MNKSTTFMKVASLQPQVEFEITKLAMLREGYLRKLKNVLTQSNGAIDIAVIGIVDTLREATLEIVETIELWGKTQVNYPLIAPYLWNGQNYLEKITEDTSFLLDYPAFANWFGFSLVFNPFLVPPEILHADFALGKESFVFFGRRPRLPAQLSPGKKDKGSSGKKDKSKKTLKSPYNTPIINDPDIIPSLSVASRLKKSIQFSNSNSARDKATDEASDPFTTILSFDAVQKIRKLFVFLTTGATGLVSDRLHQLLATVRMHPLQEDDEFAGEHDLLDSMSINSAQTAESGSVVTATSAAASMSASVAASGMDQDSVLSNQSLRLSNIHFRGRTVTAELTKIWTPHEIVLQKSVQKRGGELSVLTAASATGKIKAPWRKGRIERLYHEREYTQELLENDSMALEDLRSQQRERITTEPATDANASSALRQAFIATLEAKIKHKVKFDLLDYQINHYKLVSDGGDPLKIENQRKKKTLLDGQATDADESLTIRLEDKMARRIQSRLIGNICRRKLRVLLDMRHRCATTIQKIWRRYATASAVIIFSKKLRLAMILQRQFRRIKALEKAVLIKREAERFAAARLIQRTYRGFIGRKRFYLKKEFIQCIIAAREEISTQNLTPGHLDVMADEIELFTKDYTVSMPMCVLSVFRGILYMFNGERSETVIIYSAGYMKEKLIYSLNATWQGMELILRRKGKFLRRLRALVDGVSTPNPVRLKFTADCVAHLKELCTLTEKDFEKVGPCKESVLKLFHYCKFMKRIHELQSKFPEYFVAAHPHWYKQLLSMRYDFENLGLKMRMESVCIKRLEQKLKTSTEQGKRLGPILASLRNVTVAYDASISQHEVSKKKLAKYIVDLERNENTKIRNYENMERARALGVEISKRELSEYFRTQSVLVEHRIKELRYMVDKREIAHLECRANIIISKENCTRDREARDFDKHLHKKKLHRMCDQLGEVLADLMILQFVWKDFVKKIGGVQFIHDLVDGKLHFYKRLKIAILFLMKKRRRLKEKINAALKAEFHRIEKMVLNAKIQLMNDRWDRGTQIEIEAEEEENKECARREADYVRRRRNRQLQDMNISERVCQPILLLIDIYIAETTKSKMLEILHEVKFRVCKRLQTDPQVLVEIQSLMDQGFNVILFVDKGIHRVSRGFYVGIIRNLLSGLIPKPIVYSLTTTNWARFVPWSAPDHLSYNSILNLDCNQSSACSLLLGRIRHAIQLFSSLYRLDKPAQQQQLSPQLMQLFREDVAIFIRELRAATESNVAPSRNSTAFAELYLAAISACMLGLWTPPMLAWTDAHVLKGAGALLPLLLDPAELANSLFFAKFPKFAMTVVHQLQSFLHLETLWKTYSSYHFHLQPFRYILFVWCRAASTLLIQSSEYGGLCNFEEEPGFVAKAFLLNKNETEADIIAVTSSIINQSFEESLIYESTVCPITVFTAKNKFDDLSTRVFEESNQPRHVRIYLRGTDFYVGVSISGRNRSQFTFCIISFVDFIMLIQPTATEIFEGKIKKFNLGMDYYEICQHIIEWLRLYELDDNSTRLEIVRCQSLMFSRVGKLSGFNCRYEIYEEKYGEVVLKLFGEGGINNGILRIDESTMIALAGASDPNEEKPKLEGMDISGIASICSDRLEAVPPKRWVDFLRHGELLPSAIERKIKYHLRLKRGPGKFIGSKMANIFGLDVLVSVFELGNDSDLFAMRICIYDLKHSQSVEYRLSAIERSSLFDMSLPIFDQIAKRMKTVRCDILDKSRTFLLLGDSFEPVIPEFELADEDDFDIVRDMDRDYDQCLETALKGVDSDVDSEASDDSEDILNEIARETLQSATHSVVTDPLEGRSVGSKQGQETGQGGKTDGELGEGEDDDPTLVKRKVYQKFTWALYFSRTSSEIRRGNLTISVGINVLLKGFTVYILDNRTFFEHYYLLAFEDAARILFDYTLQKLIEDCVALDESLLQELTDELVGTIDIDREDDSLEEGEIAVKMLTNKDDDFEIFLVKLQDHILGENEVRPKRQAPMKKTIEITILEAKGLLKNGTFGTRNPFCAVKLNGTEIGKTCQKKNTLNPIWDSHHTFYHEIELTPDKQCTNNNLELEFFDSDTQANVGEFLGNLVLAENAFASLIDSGKPSWHPLTGNSSNEKLGTRGKVLLQVTFVTPAAVKVNNQDLIPHVESNAPVIKDPSSPMIPSFASLTNSLFQTNIMKNNSNLLSGMFKLGSKFGGGGGTSSSPSPRIEDNPSRASGISEQGEKGGSKNSSAAPLLPNIMKRFRSESPSRNSGITGGSKSEINSSNDQNESNNNLIIPASRLNSSSESVNEQQQRQGTMIPNFIKNFRSTSPSSKNSLHAGSSDSNIQHSGPSSNLNTPRVDSAPQSPSQPAPDAGLPDSTTTPGGSAPVTPNKSIVPSFFSGIRSLSPSRKHSEHEADSPQEGRSRSQSQHQSQRESSHETATPRLGGEEGALPPRMPTHQPSQEKGIAFSQKLKGMTLGMASGLQHQGRSLSPPNMRITSRSDFSKPNSQAERESFTSNVGNNPESGEGMGTSTPRRSASAPKPSTPSLPSINPLASPGGVAGGGGGGGGGTFMPSFLRNIRQMSPQKQTGSTTPQRPPDLQVADSPREEIPLNNHAIITPSNEMRNRSLSPFGRQQGLMQTFIGRRMTNSRPSSPLISMNLLGNFNRSTGFSNTRLDGARESQLFPQGMLTNAHAVHESQYMLFNKFEEENESLDVSQEESSMVMQSTIGNLSDSDSDFSDEESLVSKPTTPLLAKSRLRQNKARRIDIFLLSTQNMGLLQNPAGVYGLLKFDGFEIGRTAILSDVSRRVWLYYDYYRVDLFILLQFDIDTSAHSLEVEFWDGESRFKLGSLEISGERLRWFLEGRGHTSTSFNVKIHRYGLNLLKDAGSGTSGAGSTELQGGQTTKSGMENKVRILSSEDVLEGFHSKQPHKDSDYFQLEMLGFCNDENHQFYQRDMFVDQLSLNSMVKIDQKNKSDPFSGNLFVVAVWNLRVVGTLPLTKISAGQFQCKDKVSFTIRGHNYAKGCRLELYLQEGTAPQEIPKFFSRNSATILEHVIEDAAIMEMFLPANNESALRSSATTDVSVDFDQPYGGKDGVSQTRIKGVLKLKGHGLQPEDIYVRRFFIDDPKAEEGPENIAGVTARNFMRLENRPGVPSTLSLVQNMPVQNLLLSLLGLKNLKFPDIQEKNAQVVAVVAFNGVTIGQTRRVAIHSSVVWEKEYFVLHLPRGQRLEACRLEVEVFEVSASKKVFVGGKILEGEELVALMTNDPNSSAEVGQLGSFRYDLMPSWKYRVSHEVHGAIELIGYIEDDPDYHFPKQILGLKNSSHRVLRQKLELIILAASELPFASTAPAGNYEPLSLDVRWNGQQIFKSALFPPVAEYNFPQKQRFLMFVPPLYQIKDCLLQIMLWQGAKKCLGSIMLTSTELIEFIEEHSVIPDVNKIKRYRRVNRTQSPSTPNQTSRKSKDPTGIHHQSRKDIRSIVSWYQLGNVPNIPKYLQPESISGKIQMTGRLSNTVTKRQLKLGVLASMKEAPHSASHQLQFISTPLEKKVTGWRFFFENKTVEPGTPGTPGGSSIGPLQQLQQPPPPPTPPPGVVESPMSVKSIKRLKSATAMNSFLSNITLSTMDHNDSGENTARDQHANAASNLGLGAAGLSEMEAPKRTFADLPFGLSELFDIGNIFTFLIKSKVELPGMNFVKTENRVDDEERICWRGRVTPKNMIAPEISTTSFLRSNANKLVLIPSINDISVKSVVQYFEDKRLQIDDRSNQLPVCVKEIPSDGPGLAKRIYRIDISANNGSKFGHTDMNDDLAEFVSIVGAKSSELLPKDREKWNLGTIFEYIISDRMILEMIPANKRTLRGRREAIRVHAESRGNAGGSMVRFIRDDEGASAKTSRKSRTSKRQRFTQVPNAMRRRGHQTGINLLEHGHVTPSTKSNGTLKEEDETGEDKEAEDSEGSEGSEEEESESDTDSEESQQRTKINWIRICSHSHKMSGKRFLVLVLFQCSDARIERDPESFFNSFPRSRDSLSEIIVVFRAKEVRTRQVFEYALSGSDILSWLHRSFPLDLTSKYRRMKFGEFLVSNLCLRYGPQQDYIFDLNNEAILKFTKESAGVIDEPGSNPEEIS